MTSNGEVTAMLRRKMLRDIKANFAQFFSIMLLSMIAMWCYTGFQANVIGGNKARNNFESSSNFADGWIYGADFGEEQRKSIAAISGIKDAQLRTEVLGKADEQYNTAEIYCYFQNDADVTIPRSTLRLLTLASVSFMIIYSPQVSVSRVRAVSEWFS